MSIKRLFLALLILASLSFIALIRTDGFSLSKIQGPLLAGSLKEIDLPSRSALNQPFHYLAKGRQCFVFESEDHKTVIKFLNYDRFRLLFPFDRLLPTVLKDWKEKRQKRFQATLKSYELAYEMLREETGILSLHLQEGGGLPALHIVDRAHRDHSIDLNGTAFILQKKATMIFEKLENASQSGIKQGILDYIAFIQKRCSLYIADDDRDVGINFGFCDGRLLLLDPGRLFIDPTLAEPDRVSREMKIATKRFRKWVEKHHPESLACSRKIFLKPRKSQFGNLLHFSFFLEKVRGSAHDFHFFGAG